eukprot:SAG22_NODE_76_length_22248_cov_14.352070_17_plen_351_part_00
MRDGGMKTRPLREATRRLGDVVGLVDDAVAHWQSASSSAGAADATATCSASQTAPPPLVVELGCGAGVALRQLQRRTRTVPGRPAVEFVGVSNNSAGSGGPDVVQPAAGAHIRYLDADCGQHIPLPSCTAAVIFSIATLRFVRDKARLVEEAHRCLIPGSGTLLLDGSIRSTGEQQGKHCRRPIALVTIPAGSAAGGSAAVAGRVGTPARGAWLPRRAKVLPLDEFLLQCCSDTAHRHWLSERSQEEAATAARHWSTVLGMRRWDFQRSWGRERSAEAGSPAARLVLRKRPADPPLELGLELSKTEVLEHGFVRSHYTFVGRRGGGRTKRRRGGTSVPISAKTTTGQRFR